MKSPVPKKVITVPAFLMMCCKMTTQSFVAKNLGTQGHVVKSWINGDVQCRRTPRDFEGLRIAVIKLYDDAGFPMIGDILESLIIMRPDPKPEPVERALRWSSDKPSHTIAKFKRGRHD
jgi:hypothetical protein